MVTIRDQSDLEVDILRQLFFEAWVSIRHLEEQRSQFTAASVAALAVIVAAYGLGYDDLTSGARRVVLTGIFISIFALGLFGCLVLSKTYERIMYLVHGMMKAASEIDRRVPALKMVNFVEELDGEQASRYPLRASLRYATVWFWAFALAALIGGAGAFISWRG